MQLKESLIRQLLEYVECHGTGRPMYPPEIEGYTDEQVEYHIRLCDQAGFVMTSPNARHAITQLTYEGHRALRRFRCGKSLDWN